MENADFGRFYRLFLAEITCQRAKLFENFLRRLVTYLCSRLTSISSVGSNEVFLITDLQLIQYPAHSNLGDFPYISFSIPKNVLNGQIKAYIVYLIITSPPIKFKRILII